MSSRPPIDLGIAGLGPAEPIGEGGNAYVYRSRQEALDRDVAVKILKRAADEATLRRFDREQRAMGRVSQHDGMVTVHDSGINETGQPYLVMPLLSRSLRDELESRGPFPWDEAVDLIADVATTVHFAHQAGLIHRDLKPGNLMRSATGRPLVADFGIARIIDTGVSMQTTELTLTPAFSPPEALAGEDATPATDVYALGATLYALIEGHPPFVDEVTSKNLLLLMTRIKDEPIPAITTGAPGWVDDVIAAATTKDPADRISSAEHLAELLRAGRSPGPATATATATATIVQQPGADHATTAAGSAGAVSPDSERPSTTPSLEEADGSKNGRTWPKFAGSAAGVIALTAAAIVLWPDGDDTAAPVAVSPSTLAPAVDPTSPPPTTNEVEPDVVTSVSQPAFETIVLQAEDQVLTPPMTARTDLEAEGSAYVSTEQPDAGVVRFDVQVTQGGTYRFFARVSSIVPETNTDSMALRLDDGDVDTWDFFDDEGGGRVTWQWDLISTRCGGDFDRHLCDPFEAELDPSRTHTLALSGREPFSALDVIVVTNDPEFDPGMR